MRKFLGMTLPFVGALAVVAGFVAITACSGVAFSQIPPPQVDKEKKTFPLLTPIPDQVIFCATQESAVGLVEVMENDIGRARELFQKSPCGIMTATITYIRLIHQAGKMNVFQVTVGAITIFVLTDWKENGLPI